MTVETCGFRDTGILRSAQSVQVIWMKGGSNVGNVGRRHGFGGWDYTSRTQGHHRPGCRSCTSRLAPARQYVSHNIIRPYRSQFPPAVDGWVGISQLGLGDTLIR